METLVDGDYGQGMQENHDNRGLMLVLFIAFFLCVGAFQLAALPYWPITMPNYTTDCPYYDFDDSFPFAQTSTSSKL